MLKFPIPQQKINIHFLFPNKKLTPDGKVKVKSAPQTLDDPVFLKTNAYWAPPCHELTVEIETLTPEEELPEFPPLLAAWVVAALVVVVVLVAAVALAVVWAALAVVWAAATVVALPELDPEQLIPEKLVK